MAGNGFFRFGNPVFARPNNACVFDFDERLGYNCGSVWK